MYIFFITYYNSYEVTKYAEKKFAHLNINSSRNKFDSLVTNH